MSLIVLAFAGAVFFVSCSKKADETLVADAKNLQVKWDSLSTVAHQWNEQFQSQLSACKTHCAGLTADSTIVAADSLVQACALDLQKYEAIGQEWELFDAQWKSEGANLDSLALKIETAAIETAAAKEEIASYDAAILEASQNLSNWETAYSEVKLNCEARFAAQDSIVVVTEAL